QDLLLTSEFCTQASPRHLPRTTSSPLVYCGCLRLHEALVSAEEAVETVGYFVEFRFRTSQRHLPKTLPDSRGHSSICLGAFKVENISNCKQSQSNQAFAKENTFFFLFSSL